MTNTRILSPEIVEIRTRITSVISVLVLFVARSPISADEPICPTWWVGQGNGRTMSDNFDADDGTDEQTPGSFPISRRGAMKTGAAGLGLLALGGMGSMPAAAASGANKVYSAEATLAKLELANADTTSEAVVLSEGTFKTSTNTDLIINATAEIGLYTEIKTKGNDQSVASAGVECWVELDGEPVPFPPFDGGDGTLGNDFTGSDGKYERVVENASVVFNNRDFGMKTSNFGDLEAEIELFLRTRSANGFNWYIPDVGQGEHTITLNGNISQYVDGKGEAKALVGPRTLIVEPVNMSNGSN